MSSSPPPPPHPVLDESPAAELARKRFAQKSGLSRYLSLPNLRRKSSKALHGNHHGQRNTQETHPTEPFPRHGAEASGVIDPITLHGPDTKEGHCEQDHYEWAILYENQRGMTVFSIPYYSKLSLLPNDPPPFTMPNTSSKRSDQPPLSLMEYPLPDGRWRWVSKAWMIDMRSDTGEVQHDGFEYNWFFRRHNWRAEIGPLSAGGWVRRRRWVRLMMRPADKKLAKNENGSEKNSMAVPSSGEPPSSGSLHSSYQPSFADRNTPADVDLDSGWMGEMDGDWNRCHALLRRFGRDGRKLEIWKRWLGYHSTNARPDVKGKGRENCGVDVPAAEEAAPIPKPWIAAVLREHAGSILEMFIYPDSRAEFLNLIKLTMGEEFHELGLDKSVPEFWSYGRGLAGNGEAEAEASDT